MWQLYRDRWAVEQLPLAAKQMVGAERAFVFGKESRCRLPELALVAGNILAYVAATSQPVQAASGIGRPSDLWTVAAAVEPGGFSNLPCPQGQVRRKHSVTAHLPKGASAHRRTKTPHLAVRA